MWRLSYLQHSRHGLPAPCPVCDVCPCRHCWVMFQGIKPDRQREVLQYYQYSADRGNVEAQTAVGTLLNIGTHGVVRDHEAAAHYLQRAASAGSAEAMAHLGHMYGSGKGVPLVSVGSNLSRAAREAQGCSLVLSHAAGSCLFHPGAGAAGGRSGRRQAVCDGQCWSKAC